MAYEHIHKKMARDKTLQTVFGALALGFAATTLSGISSENNNQEPQNTTTLTTKKDTTRLSTDSNHESVTAQITNNYLNDNLNYEK